MISNRLEVLPEFIKSIIEEITKKEQTIVTSDGQLWFKFNNLVIKNIGKKKSTIVFKFNDIELMKFDTVGISKGNDFYLTCPDFATKIRIGEEE